MTTPIRPTQSDDPALPNYVPRQHLDPALPGFAPPASDATRQVAPSDTPLSKYDRVQGAPIKVRLALAAVPEAQREELAKTLLPGAHMTKKGLAFTAPDGTPTFVEPRILGNPSLKANVGNLLTAPGKIGTAVGAILGGGAGTAMEGGIPGPGTLYGAAGGGAFGGRGGQLLEKIFSAIAGNPNADTSSVPTAMKAMLADAKNGALQEALGLVGGKAVSTGVRKAGNVVTRSQEAANSGIPLTVGQTLDSPILKGAIEAPVSVLPTGRGVMGRFGARQAEAAKAEAEHLAQMIAGQGPGVPVPTREEAGNIAINAAKRIGEQYRAALPGLKEQVAVAVQKVIPRGTVIPKELRALRTNLKALANDPKNALAAHAEGALAHVDNALAAAKANGGVLDLRHALDLRTEFNDVAKFVPLTTAKSTMGQRFLKNAATALNRDIQATVKSAGPEAEKAFAELNNHVKDFRSGSGETPADFWGRVEQATSPGQAFDLITKHPNNSAKLLRIREAMGPQDFQPIAARHFLDLGRATPGAQTTAGDVFSPETFVTNWNKGMTSAERKALYGDPAVGGDLPEPIHHFTRTLDAIKSSAAYRNPSGTAGMLQGTQFLRNIMNDLTTTPALAQEAATASTVGATHPLAGAMGVVGPAVVGKGMTSPLAVGAVTAGARLAQKTPPVAGEWLGRLLSQYGIQ